MKALGSLSGARSGQLVEVATAAAEAGAAVASRWRRDPGSLVVEEKQAPDDLVSQADRDAEQAIRAVIEAERPGDAILGEEHGHRAGGSGVRWAVDPIDGTTNYLHGRADWAVSVAAVREIDAVVIAAAVAEPAHGLVTTASATAGTHRAGRRLGRGAGPAIADALVEVNFGSPAQRSQAGAVVGALVPRTRDVRRGGSAAAALAQVADGRADAYWGPGLQEWDIAAGMLLVTEAGGAVGGLAGPEPECRVPGGDLLAAASVELWEELAQVLRGVWR